MSRRPAIACIGAGRMARGIAVVFAYAGHRVTIVDVKARDAADCARVAKEAHRRGARHAGHACRHSVSSRRPMWTALIARVSVVPEADAAGALADAAVIFEGVPEVPDLKREVLARVSALAGPAPIIASTTSTILVDDLSGAVAHPERFLNAHWLNPGLS